MLTEDRSAAEADFRREDFFNFDDCLVFFFLFAIVGAVYHWLLNRKCPLMAGYRFRFRRGAVRKSDSTTGAEIVLTSRIGHPALRNPLFRTTSDKSGHLLLRKLNSELTPSMRVLLDLYEHYRT